VVIIKWSVTYKGNYMIDKDKVQELLEQVRPYLQADGGDVELVEITEEGIVKLRLQGACRGCPSSSMTMKMGIEDHLKKHIPEIASVESIF
jgi:Fe-S cluster biogenesis protein NfuA